MSLLSIKNLHVSIKDTEILHGVSLEIAEGETHAIMGPNGSGKSTLVNTLMGHPAYTVTKGEVIFRDQNLLEMETHERARAGLFLAFQHPKEIDGVTLRSFLFAAKKAQSDDQLSSIKFQKQLLQVMEELKMDPELAERSLNKGFSGGEKKKVEVLQLKILEPRLALLDETDSGLDIDALKIVSDGINSMCTPEFAALVVTHYTRILKYITPDHIHVMVNGKIVENGGAELATKLETSGYEQY